MRRTWWIIMLVLLVGCAGPGADYDAPAEEAAVAGPKVEYQEPEPMAVPEYQESAASRAWPRPSRSPRASLARRTP